MIVVNILACIGAISIFSGVVFMLAWKYASEDAKEWEDTPFGAVKSKNDHDMSD